MSCEWMTPDGPCPNEKVGSVDVKFYDRDEQRIDHPMELDDVASCDHHMTEALSMLEDRT